MDFKKYNKYIGWAVFAISAIVYLATMERSVSLWDCGEYIATSHKLEVGHPPGAPLYQMINRVLTAFVPGTSVALVINAVSALSSAFTILFLFWTITIIGEKMAKSKVSLSNMFSKDDTVLDTVDEKDSKLDDGQKWAILGSGIIGALVYTFTDSFWFSAVEAEVYAMSSFFTALVFWAAYKWDQAYDTYESGETKRNPDYWLAFIMFMVGLSIGVHLLNLLAIPAISYIYYFKKFKKTSWKGFILTGIIAMAVLTLIQDIIIPKTASWASGIEIYFTNSMGMPIGFGSIFFFILLISILVGGLIYSKKKNWVNVNTAFLSLSLLYVGYSCFAMVLIRSNADTPIDENNPEDFVSFESYVLREQYGDRPLLTGQQFNSVRSFNREDYGDRRPVYKALYVVKDANDDAVDGFVTEEEAQAYIDSMGIDGSIRHEYYMTQDRKNEIVGYQDGHTVFLPRMYSDKPEHIEEYKAWSGYPAKPEAEEGREATPYFDQRGNEVGEVYLPTTGENFGYMFKYQLNHMFFRYFMWNFAGRQNDEHNQRGGITNGNWQTGINFIDQEFLGDQSELPEHRANNYANNKYFLLPLILGLIGLFYQLFRNWKDWFTVMLLFIFTGILVVVYLNQKPLEPRERDYAYAAAFYAFSFWIGLSVYAIYDLMRSVDWKGFAKIMVYPLGAGVFFLTLESINDNPHTLSYTVLYMTAVAAAIIALFKFLKTYLKDIKQQAIAITAVLAFVPLLMAFQNWDDHDRSGRYTPREMAKNYLKGCAPQSILFTNGDNDTFPLWYIQEVEEYRTDVRTVNLSLANTSWYIEQMKRKAYESEALPISFIEHQYREGQVMDFAKTYSGTVNEFKSDIRRLASYLIQSSVKNKKSVSEIMSNYAQTQLKGSNGVAVASGPMINCAKYNPVSVDAVVKDIWKELIESKAFTAANRQEFENILIGPNLIATIDKYYSKGDFIPEIKRVIDEIQSQKFIEKQGESRIPYIPYKSIKIPVDKQTIIDNEVVPENMYNRIAEEVTFSIPKTTLYKADILILDLIAESDWDRPIYFAGTAGRTTYLGLHNYFLTEGLVYRLSPIKGNSPFSQVNIFGTINTDKMFDVVMNQWDWGNLKGNGINADYYNRRPVSNFRLQYYVLAETLIKEGNPEDAVTVLNKSLEEFPDSKIPFDNFTGIYIQTYMDAYEALVKNGNSEIAANAVEQASFISERLKKYALDDINYFSNFRWDLFVHNRSVDDVVYSNYKHFTSEMQQIEKMDARIDALKEQIKQGSGDVSKAKTILATYENVANISKSALNEFKNSFLTKWDACIATVNDSEEDEALIAAKSKLAADEYMRIFGITVQNKFQEILRQDMKVGANGQETSPAQEALMNMQRNDMMLQQMGQQLQAQAQNPQAVEQLKTEMQKLNAQRGPLLNAVVDIFGPHAGEFSSYSNVVNLMKQAANSPGADDNLKRSTDLLIYFGL